MNQHPGRRQFVKVAAAAIATSRFPILGANDRINVGIVGLGGRGTDHIGFYSKFDSEVRIAGLCDVNQAARERAAATVKRNSGYDSKEYPDMRAMFDAKDIDAVSIAAPNHWHALSTIWACQAGKDVYVEKPASHNIFEGRQMVKAARKYNRMVQVGSQSRSLDFKQRAVKLLHDGIIGKIYHARGVCYRRRLSIGKTPDSPVPAGVDWDLFLGPAPKRPFNANRFIYNWHWFWDTGNGDMGNQGVHEMDIALWGLGREGYPSTVVSAGGKFAWDDDQETPNTLQTTFAFGNEAQLTFDTRNLPTPPEGIDVEIKPNYVGNTFFGSLGFMVVDHQGFEVYKSTAGEISGEAARGAGAGGKDRYEQVMKEKAGPNDTEPHMANFFKAIRARDHKILNADIEIGARSAAYCHLGNNAYRVGRMLRVDQKTARVFNDSVAESLATRKPRPPYVVPENV